MVVERLCILLALLTTFCCCGDAVEHRSRDFKLVNLSGCSLGLSSIDKEAKEQREELILNGSTTVINSMVGHEFGVTANNCTERKSTSFQVNENFDQVVWIEEGLEVFVEDDMTEHPHLRLNSDFSLFYEMNAWTSLDDHFGSARLVWQLELYRTRPIASLMENKLLRHSLLVSMEMPLPEIYYGAFARKEMGEWPKYNRQDFIEKLKDTPQVAEDHLFVVKPASLGLSKGVMVMNDKKWTSEGWTLNKLADYVESFLDLSESEWGMQYEHVGVLVQESVLPQGSLTEPFAADFDSSVVFEIQPHVVFGELGFTGLIPVPRNPNAYLEFTFCEDEKPNLKLASDTYGANSSLWEIVEPNLPTDLLSKVARRIAYAFGVDFFRLDVFIDLNGMFLVNEVTYAGYYQHMVDDCTDDRLFHAYKHAALDIVEPRSILEPLLHRINVPYDLFVESADYQYMNSKSEEAWQDYHESFSSEDWEDERT